MSVSVRRCRKANKVVRMYSMTPDFKKRLFCLLSKISLRKEDANDPLWRLF